MGSERISLILEDFICPFWEENRDWLTPGLWDVFLSLGTGEGKEQKPWWYGIIPGKIPEGIRIYIPARVQVSISSQKRGENQNLQPEKNPRFSWFSGIKTRAGKGSLQPLFPAFQNRKITGNLGFWSPSEGKSGCGWPAAPDSLHSQLLQKELKITSSLAPGALGSPGNDLLGAGEGFISSWNRCLWIFLKRKINPFYHNIAIFLNDRTSIFIHLVLPPGESIGITSFSLDLLMSWHQPLLALEPRQRRCSETWICFLYRSPFPSLFFPLLPPWFSSSDFPVSSKWGEKALGSLKPKKFPSYPCPAWMKYREAKHICEKSFSFFFSLTSDSNLNEIWDPWNQPNPLKLPRICHTFGKLCIFK